MNLGLSNLAAPWGKVWYESGLMSGQCQRVALQNRRDLLLCEHIHDAMGVDEQSLYTIHPDLRKSNRRDLLTATDNLRTCSPNLVLQRAYIESAVMKILGGKQMLQVFVQRGLTRKFSDVELARYCFGLSGKGVPEPVLRRYELHYLLASERLVPTSESLPSLRLIARVKP